MIPLQAALDHDEVPASTVALYDALDCASLALIRAEAGDRARAEAAFLEATVAAAEAFPLSSPESQALGVILAAVSRAVEGREMTGAPS